MFIIQHNTFSNLSDHMSQYMKQEFNQYMKQEFNGSKAAEKKRRIKTSAIVSCIGNNSFQ